MHPKNTPFSRRHMIAAASAAASLTALPKWTLHAADPIEGRTAPKFKYSLAAYSYRSLLTGKNGTPAEMDLLGFIDECADMQLDGAELTSYYMPDEPSKDYLIGLRTACFRKGLAVSGTAIRNDFGFPPGPDREQQLAHVRRWIDNAAILHAPMIRIFAGHQKKGVSAEQTHQWMVEGMTESCQYAARHGIYLALENHGGPTASAEGLLKLVQDVDSPWLGVNLDTGNFREGGDPYQQMTAAVPYAVNVQVKVVVRDARGNDQPMDFARLRSILSDANYRGFVVLEYEEDGDVRKECRHFVQQMRTALNGDA
ncbi:MAG: sugar phosphate isomerase/epimerase family protein [Pirellulaceae bacterium]